MSSQSSIAHRIVAAARAHHDATIDQIAAHAGVAKATVYRHFGSKSALLEAAGREQQTDAPREQILDAAMRTIPRYGLAGVTMERIAEEAGLSPPALYWHFKSKDDLLLAMVERVADSIDPLSVLGELPALDDPATTIRAFVRRVIAAQAVHVELMRTMVIEVGSRPELAALFYDRIISRIWGGFAAYLELQAARGAFRPGHAMLRVVALAGMATFFNLARRNFGDRLDVPSPEQAGDDLVDIFLRGVLNGSDRS